ncbi:hypothetical protein TrST_g5506 [Triparma strigata]|uniref:Uncharacterized protein n=1 Tax=Triparma strigata TaxID=1606541 RepID=A0A9W7E0Y5_9STRA|nr:hypothetical protein TrST_g5506 [Triparma strigata]
MGDADGEGVGGDSKRSIQLVERAKKYVVSSLCALVFFAIAAPLFNVCYVQLGGDGDSKVVAIPLVTSVLFSVFAVWFLSWWFEGLRGIAPLLEVVVKPFGISSTLAVLYLVVLVVSKTVVGFHIVGIIAVGLQGFGCGGARKLIESSGALEAITNTRLKRIAFCHFVAVVWTSMILTACGIMSLYPYMFWRQNITDLHDENYGGLSNSAALNAVLLGCLFGIAKSTLVTLFVFVAAPLCAKVIEIVRRSREEIDEGERKNIMHWCELTILRFTKGVFSSLVLVPLLCLHEYTSFLLALASSFFLQLVMGEVVLHWWVVKGLVRKKVVQKAKVAATKAAKGSFIQTIIRSVSTEKGNKGGSSVMPALDDGGGLKEKDEETNADDSVSSRGRVKSFKTILQTLKSDDEWLRRIDILREHVFCDQMNVVSNSCILLLVLLFPLHFKLQSHQSEKLDSLLFSEGTQPLAWFFFRVATLLVVEHIEYKLLYFRLQRIYRQFKGFRPIEISNLGYLQNAAIPTLSMFIIFLLFPAFWLG